MAQTSKCQTRYWERYGHSLLPEKQLTIQHLSEELDLFEKNGAHATTGEASYDIPGHIIVTTTQSHDKKNLVPYLFHISHLSPHSPSTTATLERQAQANTK